MTLMSGCGGGVPKLTPAEEKGLDDLFVQYGSGVLLHSRISYMELDGAARRSQYNQIQYLVSKGANVNAIGEGGLYDSRTPLHLAARSRNIEIIKFLVSKGANVNAKDRDGETPLHVAAAHYDLETMKFLVSKGADVNAKTSRWTASPTISSDRFPANSTPLHYVARYSNFDAMGLLVNPATDVLEIVKFLVSAGADVHAKNDDGNTPIDNAKRGNHVGMVEYLSNL
jgi:cytohesin